MSIYRTIGPLVIPVIGDKDINKCSISRWVKFAIKNAYSSISSNSSKLLNPRAHELRALPLGHISILSLSRRFYKLLFGQIPRC